MILVTGGAGYIGSHVAEALHKAGFEPVVYDNLSHGHAHAVKWGPLVVGDIADGKLLAATLRKYKIDAVIHLAARIEVGDSMRAPLDFFNTNVGGSIALLRAMVACGVPTVVFASSCAVYGAPGRMPMIEQHPTAPNNAYGASKLMVEQLLRWSAAVHGIRYAALRCFNAAGADPDGELGEEHRDETHLIPLVLEVARGAARAIEVFGTDWDTEDGTCVRDYVHVADLADAHVRALRHLRDGGAPLTLNLATGRGYSVLDIVKSAERVTGGSVPVRIAARRDGDVSSLVGDASAAATILGWRPALSDLDTIIGGDWKWRTNRHAASWTEAARQARSI